MKRKIKILFVLMVLASSLALSGCANMRWSTNAGVNLNFGPNGVRLDPHVSLNLYNGGRF